MTNLKLLTFLGIVAVSVFVSLNALTTLIMITLAGLELLIDYGTPLDALHALTALVAIAYLLIVSLVTTVRTIKRI